MSEPEVTRIEVEMGKRYVIVVKGVLLRDDMTEAFRESLLEWWQGNDPVCVLNLGDGMDIEFVRVGEEGE